jgi:hypothetical protein
MDVTAIYSLSDFTWYATFIDWGGIYDANDALDPFVPYYQSGST